MVISVPTGLGAAIFVSEFCGRRTREVLKVVIEFLAAIPSVVWGFIGYMILNPLIVWVTGVPIGVNVLNGGIILALMSVPIIMSMGEDALKAVPDTYREAALALAWWLRILAVALRDLPRRAFAIRMARLQLRIERARAACSVGLAMDRPIGLDTS